MDPRTVLPFIILAELLASFKSLFKKNLTVKIFFNYLFVSSILLIIERREVKTGSTLLLSFILHTLLCHAATFIGSCAGSTHLHPSTKPHTSVAYFANLAGGILCADSSASAVFREGFCCDGGKLFKFNPITSVDHAPQVCG